MVPLSDAGVRRRPPRGGLRFARAAEDDINAQKRVMATIKDMFEAQKVVRNDAVGLDFGATNIKAVRIRSHRGRKELTAAALLPAVRLDTPPTQRLSVPGPLCAKYAAACHHGAKSTLRLLRLQAGSGRLAPAEQARQQLGADYSFRVAFAGDAAPAAGKPAAVVAAAAVPEDEIRALLHLAASGDPAIASYELAPLCALNAFLMAQAERGDGEALCLAESGTRTVTYFFLVKDRLALIRRHEAGSGLLMRALAEHMGVDGDTAIDIVRGGAIDLTGTFQEVMGPAVKELSIARDFVERQENCRLSRICVSGGLAVSRFWRDALRAGTGLPVEVLNPVAALGKDAVLPEDLRGQEPRFAAAIGAALGILGP